MTTTAKPITRPAGTSATIQLKRLELATIELRVVGKMPLIVHRFDEKTKQQMLDNQQQRTTAAKAPKDPQADYERSLYRLPDGRYGFPATGFKAAAVDAARYFPKVKMTELRQALLFIGEGNEQLVALEGEPEIREDAVRVGMGTADLRYRAMFPKWAATLTIEYVPSLLSQESVVALVDAGGKGGIGEWRPSKAKTGSFGTFQVEA